MNKEFKKRKKRFWALCLALVFALVQAVPLDVLAANYTVSYAPNSTVGIIDDVVMKEGDTITYLENVSYAGNLSVYYLDVDGSQIYATPIASSTTEDTQKTYTLEGYSFYKEHTANPIPEEQFAGWKATAISGVSGGYTTSMKFQAVAYTQSTITYVLDSGTDDAANPATNPDTNPTTYYEGKEEIALADASKDGYVFDGWYSDVDFTTKVTAIPVTQIGDVTLYAKFTLIIDGEGSIAVDDVYYGEPINPILTSATNGTDHVTVEYKEKGADDSSYTTEVPVKAGSYTARATFAMKGAYAEVTATDDFTIFKKIGTGSVTVADVNYGKMPEPVVVSSTNGTNGVTIEYKQRNASDDMYTSIKPFMVGEYTVRAIFGETEGYQKVTVTDNFTIHYLHAPASPYSIYGKTGENNYYTSAVSILPANGYLIADSLDGTYKDKLEFTKSSQGILAYLINTATGEKTSGIKVPDISIDKDAPVIQNAVTGETIYGDKAEITITDDNLRQVFVNGEPVEFENGKAVLTLSSNQGEENYEIIGVDDAGNKKTIHVVVAADWMKTRQIPAGEKVKLFSKYSYTLGSGTWTVSGDSTTYTGGTSFRVKSDGEYTFSNSN